MTTVSADFARFCSLVAVAASGGVLWYAYTHPFDRETYIQSLSNPTAYEMEGLTPKQVFAVAWVGNAIDCRTHLFDEQNVYSSHGKSHESGDVSSPPVVHP